MEVPCLQDTGDSPEVVSVAGEVQAGLSWRNSREAFFWVRDSRKAGASCLRLRTS